MRRPDITVVSWRAPRPHGSVAGLARWGSLLVIALLAVCLLHAAPAQARPSYAATQRIAHSEYIADFASDIEVQPQGDLIVTEYITVNTAGQQIQHGIVRDFPTLARDRDGLRKTTGFEILEIRRDGQSEPYQVDKLSNGVRIRIGTPRVWLPSGLYHYEIHYRTTRQIGFFEQFDELYWNVTGNGWTLPIAHASARIHLPENTEILRTSFYTGEQGMQGKAAQLTENSHDVVAFQTTAPLRAHEGLTVAAAWPKGIVQPPSAIQVIVDRLRDNAAITVAVSGFALLALYYLIAYAASRRRRHTDIEPCNEPPAGMSAAAVRYMTRKGHDERSFAIAIIELIALRALRIDRNNAKTGDIRFQRDTPDTQGELGLQRDPLLSAMLDKLFRKDRRFKRGTVGDSRLRAARFTMITTLHHRYAGYLESHTKWAKTGLGLWLLYVIACIAAIAIQGDAFGDILIALSIMAFGAGVLTAGYNMRRDAGAGAGTLIVCLIFGLAFVGAGLSILHTGQSSMSLLALPAILPALIFPVVIRAFRFMRGYTETGRALMDNITAFKRYLTHVAGPNVEALASEADRLRYYERYLPYAMALDIGKQWSIPFASLIAAVGGATAVQMTQRYADHNLITSDFTHAFRDFGHDVTPTPASSSSSVSGGSDSWSGGGADASSSGSSDGGSSGDGGGGGGGSGW